MLALRSRVELWTFPATTRSLRAFAASLLAAAAHASAQQIIHVPGDAPTVLIGIVLASDGDTVLVAPGTYQERIDFFGKAIEVRSEFGPAATRIDASGLSAGWPGEDPYGPDGPTGSHRVVRFVSGEGLDSILDGFTIRGADYGCGPTCDGGGVLAAPGAQPTIRNCIIEENGDSYGGGVHGSPYLEACTVQNNRAGFQGGGVYGSPTMVNCVVQSNHAMTDRGGGVYGAAILIDCAIVGNASGGDGYPGGGVHGAAALVRCLVADNSRGCYLGDTGGAGAYAVGLVDRCVIVGNHESLGGAPACFEPNGTGLRGAEQVTNTIIRGNVYFGPYGPPTPSQVSAGLSISYSDVEGGYPGYANIDADPLFLDPEAGDYRLQPGSPCIDAGDPVSELDPDGTIADIGMHPFAQASQCPVASLIPADAEPFDHVGSAVALFANYALLGVPDSDDAGFESGAAYVIVRSGDAWGEQAKLVVGDSAPGDRFGHAVALHGGYALVGARGHDGLGTDAGAAYLFQREHASWTELATLLPWDGGPGDGFGSSVVVHADLVAIAAPGDDGLGAGSGAVYVYRSAGAGWVEEAKLVASDGAAGDGFGADVALDAGVLVIGASGDDHVSPDAGSAYVFRRDGIAWVEEAKLVASDAAGGDGFGAAVALHGDRVVVGAPFDDDAGLESGSARVFRLEAGAWIEEAVLVTEDGAAGDQLGFDVALHGSQAVVGAPYADASSGAAYLFQRDEAGGWKERKGLLLPGGGGGERFGWSVAASGDHALVGAVWDDVGAQDSGSVTSFHLPGEECPPTFESIAGALAQLPGVVAATGLQLDDLTAMWVDGSAASIVDQGPDAILFAPAPAAPGLATVQGTSPEATADGILPLWPVLSASTTGAGGTVDVEIANGSTGICVVAFGLEAVSPPLSIPSPPTWYGLVLDPTTLHVLASGPIPHAAPVVLSFPVADAPALRGLLVHLQAWCQQGGAGLTPTWSFTNAAEVIL